MMELDPAGIKTCETYHTHLRGIGNFTSSYGQIRQNFLPIPKYVLELCTLKLERSRGDFYYMRGLRVWAKKIA